jgi:hypothetical protein
MPFTKARRVAVESAWNKDYKEPSLTSSDQKRIFGLITVDQFGYFFKIVPNCLCHHLHGFALRLFKQLKPIFCELKSAVD